MDQEKVVTTKMDSFPTLSMNNPIYKAAQSQKTRTKILDLIKTGEFDNNLTKMLLALGNLTKSEIESIITSWYILDYQEYLDVYAPALIANANLNEIRACDQLINALVNPDLIDLNR